MASGSISFDVDISRAKKKLKGLEKVVDKATFSTLKRTTRTVRSLAVKEVAKSTGLKQAKVRKIIFFDIHRAEMFSVVRPKKAFPNLVEYMTDAQIKSALIRVSRKGGRVRPRGKGVRAKSWGKSKVYDGAFIGRGQSSGKYLIFAREGEGRDSPIRALPGASPYIEFDKPELKELLKRKARTTFQKEFDRNLKFFLSKAKI